MKRNDKKNSRNGERERERKEGWSERKRKRRANDVKSARCKQTDGNSHVSSVFVLRQARNKPMKSYRQIFQWNLSPKLIFLILCTVLDPRQNSVFVQIDSRCSHPPRGVLRSLYIQRVTATGRTYRVHESRVQYR